MMNCFRTLNIALALKVVPVVLAASLLSYGAAAQNTNQNSGNSEELINVLVSEKGVYEIRHDELLNLGLDLSGETLTSISLFNNEVQVPIQIVGSESNALEFGDGAYIRFIGDGIESLYTDNNVYTLRLDSTTKERITPETLPISNALPYAQSYLETKRYAPQNGYTFASPNKKDPWHADRVLALRQPASKTISLELENYVPGGNTGSTSPTMKAEVWGGTDLPGFDDDHHIRFKLNGQTVIDNTFDGFAQKIVQTPVSNLQAGANQIRMELPLDQGYDYEAVNLNTVELSYPRAFVAKSDALSFNSIALKFQVRGFSDEEIAVYRKDNNGNVSMIDNAAASGRCTTEILRCRVRFGGHGSLSEYHVVAPKGIKTPEFEYLPIAENIRSGSAEYLIITHPDFIADEGEQDLLGELATSLQSQFSSVDIVDVEQIYAQFGAHIFDPSAIQRYIKFAHDNRNTQVVLLVGGDIYDYKGFENQDARSFIPSIYVSTDDMINFAPVDAKYVDFDNNNVPDLPIGRLPVRSMQELGVLLDKRTDYLNRNYRDKALFVAGEFDILRQYSFKLDALSVQQTYLNNWNVDNVFLDDVSTGNARSQIRQSINSGVSLTSFFGHSSTNQWTFDGLFNSSDAANLTNQGKPTIVTQWGCWNTYYVNPNEDSMGHRFLMEGDRGAVAVMGATTLTSASNEQLLANYVYQELSQGKSLGQAVTNAKQEFASVKPNALDVLLGWTLLGFPELVLQ